jgi:hypothetical protein
MWFNKTVFGWVTGIIAVLFMLYVFFSPLRCNKEKYSDIKKQEHLDSAKLSNIELSSGKLVPLFMPDTLNYKVTYGRNENVTQITIIPVVPSLKAVIQVNGATVTTGSSSANIPIVKGLNTVTISVVTKGGVKKYKLTVMKL